MTGDSCSVENLSCLRHSRHHSASDPALNGWANLFRAFGALAVSFSYIGKFLRTKVGPDAALISLQYPLPGPFPLR